MKISEIKVYAIAVPLAEEVRFARRVVQERHYAIVRICTSNGIEGAGVTYCGHKGSRLVTSVIKDFFRDLLIGRDPRNVKQLWSEMYHESLLVGRRGGVLRGLSAVDMALWDIKAKEANQPLYKYLGAARHQIPVYASNGYYFSGGLENLVEEVESYVKAGYKAVKMKVGRVSLTQDVERVKKVRGVLGPKLTLLLDANNAWKNLHSAWEAMRAFEEFSPSWIEEPFYPDEITLHKALRSRIKTPVATGEHANTCWEFNRLMEAKAADIIQPDVATCGGVTEWIRIANLGASYGVDVAPHWLHDVHVHLACAVPNVIYVEYFTDTKVLNLMDLFESTVQPENGVLKPPDRPGLGLTWNWNTVSKYALGEKL